jgi:hypothetical protein
MASRLPSFLPRLAVVVLVVLAASAGLTFAADQQITAGASPAAQPAAQHKVATIVVPDVRHQAFVFAKGQLEDLGFAWHVAGGVHGFAANVVVAQSPAAGTKLLNTGAPLVTLTLARNGKYKEEGSPEDAAPYHSTPTRLADAAVAPVAVPKPAAAPKPAATPTKKTTAAAPAAKAPAKRPPDFVVPGARKEPLDEVPLPARAAQLGAWLAQHPKPTNASVQHWLYQNAWIVSGARMGWWHGAEALRTLIAVDQKTESLWGIGGKSQAVARRALAEVQARAK